MPRPRLRYVHQAVWPLGGWMTSQGLSDARLGGVLQAMSTLCAEIAAALDSLNPTGLSICARARAAAYESFPATDRQSRQPLGSSCRRQWPCGAIPDSGAPRSLERARLPGARVVASGGHRPTLAGSAASAIGSQEPSGPGSAFRLWCSIRFGSKSGRGLGRRRTNERMRSRCHMPPADRLALLEARLCGGRASIRGRA
jgi:hypothetical protein